MFSFHLKLMWTSSRDERLHNWRKESTTSTPCTTVRTQCCCSSSALPRQGQALSWGRKSLFNAHSLWSGTNPVTPRSCWLCQHCHGSAVQHSRGQQCAEAKGLQAGGTRPHYWSVWANISTKPQQLSVVSRISELLYPPINSHPRLHGNKPRLGTCLKGELSIGKLDHIRKYWQTLPE